MTFEGGCYCGQVRYVAEGKPRLKAQCHCRECQYISSGAPNMFMLMAPEGFRYVSGTPKTFTRGDLSQPVTREFLRKLRHASHDPSAGPASGDPEGRNPRRPEPLWRPKDGDLYGRQAAVPHDPGGRAGVRKGPAALIWATGPNPAPIAGLEGRASFRTPYGLPPSPGGRRES
jgi:hypothetical protein